MDEIEQFLRQAEPMRMPADMRERIEQRLATASSHATSQTTGGDWVSEVHDGAGGRKSDTAGRVERSVGRIRRSAGRVGPSGKVRRRLGVLGAGVAAVLVVGMVVAGVLYRDPSRSTGLLGGVSGGNNAAGTTNAATTNSSTTDNSATEVNSNTASVVGLSSIGPQGTQGYGTWQQGDYQKMLGFTPILPVSVPNGAKLAQTMVTTYHGIQNAPRPDFSATYMLTSGSQQVFDFMIQESVGAKSIDLSKGWQPFKVGGKTLYKPTSNSEMVKWLYIKGDLAYGITFNNHLTDAEAGQILISVTKSVIDAPTVVAASFQGMSGARQVLSFNPVEPSYVPVGFKQTSFYGRILREQQKEISEQLTILYESASPSPNFQVVEGRVTPPQAEAAPGVTGSAHRSTVQIHGQNVSVTTYDKTHGVLLFWVNRATGVWYQVGSSAVFEDQATMEKVMGSIIARVVGQ